MDENRTNNGGATKLVEFRDANALGASLEDPYHNVGHMLVSSMTSGVETDEDDMGFTFSSHRDPIFWAWHKHIDDVSARWQDLDGARPPSTARVSLRQRLDDGDRPHDSPDIIVRRFDPPDRDRFTDPQAALGGDRWDERVAPAEADRQLPRSRPFTVYLRLENDDQNPQGVRVQLWTVRTAEVNDRRRWIELDDFQLGLQPAERRVVERWSGDFSSLSPHGGALRVGWPAELLLPGHGDYLLLAFASGVDGHSHHRPMGFPFDRPWPDSIDETLSSLDGAATLSLTVVAE